MCHWLRDITLSSNENFIYINDYIYGNEEVLFFRSFYNIFFIFTLKSMGGGYFDTLLHSGQTETMRDIYKYYRKSLQVLAYNQSTGDHITMWRFCYTSMYALLNCIISFPNENLLLSFFNFWRTSVLIVGSLFWTSGDVCRWFQSQGRSLPCMIRNS